MLTKRSISAAILLSAIFVSACGDSSPSAPSPPAQVTPPAAPPTEVLGQWNVTARLTATSGDKCIAEAVQSLIGAPRPYSIIVTQPVPGST